METIPEKSGSLDRTGRRPDVAAAPETTIIGMKLFERVEDRKRSEDPASRRDPHYGPDRGHAARLNWTVGITADDLVGDSAARSSAWHNAVPNGSAASDSGHLARDAGRRGAAPESTDDRAAGSTRLWR